MTPVEHAFWPDEQGPVGLLLCHDEEGRRRTVPVEGGWLRFVLEQGQDLSVAIFQPEDELFPVAAAGWPEDWEPGSAGLLDTVADDLSQGVPWQDIVRAVRAASRGRS